jgi:hypothetical protein
VLDARPLCGECKARIVRAVERGESLDEGDRRPSPWEERPTPITLLRTAKLVLLSPRAFFSGLRRRGFGHVSYFLIVNWIGVVTGVAVGERMPWNTDVSSSAMMLVWIPVIGVAIFLLNALVVHASLQLVGGNGAGLRATMRTVLYAQSLLLLSWLPLLDTVLFTPWYLWLVPVGLKRMHGTTTARAIAATAVPAVFWLWAAVDSFADAVRWAVA